MSVSGLPSVETIAASLAMSYGAHVNPPEGGKDWRAAENVLALFEAAVPRIRAEVLREAADGMSYSDGIDPGGYLTERADQIESEAGQQ